MKNTGIYKVVGIVVLAAFIGFFIAGCGGGEDDPAYTPDPDDPAHTHEHDFSGGWKSDAAQHWHECPEDGEKADLADHTVGSWTQTKAPSILADGEESRICTVCEATLTRSVSMVSMIEAVQIKAGTFTMGSPEDEPGRNADETQHQVTLTKGFYMGVYPVTQKQYEAVTGKTLEEQHKNATYDNGTVGEGDKYPMYYVSWYDALVFCNKLSVIEGLTPAYSISDSIDPKDWGDVPTISNDTWNGVTIVDGSNGWRLPTEAQWEYACRAGTKTAFNWDTNYIDDNKANYYASYVDANNLEAGKDIGKTSEVGSYAPNAWDLYDMHGNVFEWCWDWMDPYYGAAVADEAQTDPDGAVNGGARVERGGSWYLHSPYARSACRSYNNPNSRSGTLGFRLVRP